MSSMSVSGVVPFNLSRLQRMYRMIVTKPWEEIAMEGISVASKWLGQTRLASQRVH